MILINENYNKEIGSMTDNDCKDYLSHNDIYQKFIRSSCDVASKMLKSPSTNKELSKCFSIEKHRDELRRHKLR